jgi:penicillin-binding protein 1C
MEKRMLGLVVLVGCALRLTRPTLGLQLAMDPRIPDDLEVFPFTLPETMRPIRTEWLVDGCLAGRAGKGEQRFLSPLSRGEHTAVARVWLPGSRDAVETRPVTFRVK